MEAAHMIRESMGRVVALRDAARADPALATAVLSIKRLQARRFAGTYADLLAQHSYRSATRFFLDELYGEQDFAQRDAQFARIADALQTLFPKPVVALASTLAQLHVLTEELDFGMARAWLACAKAADTPEALRYLRAWALVGQPAQRATQLQMVVETGHALARLTRMPGLRSMLKLMRRPAQASGLGNLQHFLETGFDTFAVLARQTGAVELFLGWVQERETQWMDHLFQPEDADCLTRLQACLDRGVQALRA
jgi:hypothetical protein